MKKVISLLTFSSILLVGSCNLFHDDPELPPVTMEGKNTFGCRVNGKIWIPKGMFNVPPTYANYSVNFLTFNGVRENSNFSFLVRIPIVEGQIYSLTDTAKVKAYYQVSKDDGICTYNDYDISSGSLTFLKFDLGKKILAGTFEFTTHNTECVDVIKVTEGRFDISEINW